MNRAFFLLIVGVLCVAGWSYNRNAQAQTESLVVSPHLVISQFQPGRTGTTSDQNDEFIEIHNTSAAAIDLNGSRLVYRSQAGTTDVGPLVAWNTSTILQPGQFYLIASNSYTGGVTPDATYSTSACQCSLSASNGGLAIRQGSQDSGAIIDAVGWGTGSNIFFEGTRTTAPGSGNSKTRLQLGCQDTDNNSADFSTSIPWAPRNTASSAAPCSGGGTTLFAAINANPTTVSAGGNVLFTVTVIPATTPPSGAIGVAADLQSIGGVSSQQFSDDGTNGDVTPGDNVFSFQVAVTPHTTGGTKVIAGAAADQTGRTALFSTQITVNAPLPNDDPLLLGNPSNATADVANENNYLMIKPQYTLSYNRQKATPNWVAWRLDSTWLGSADRQDDYRPDPALPAGWYQVQDADYSNSGYTRGHMTPSGDRTRSIPDNSATFLMTNFVPQTANNNSGPWQQFEDYCRTLANQGNELYIFSGGYGSLGTIAGGKISVPQYTWKVVLILPNGDNDRSRVYKATRAFGIVVPNFEPLNPNTPWRNFRVTVDKVEALTGYDFFTNVSAMTQMFIERQRDRL
ncbi:MAG TPA: DNA/RNA non-specific endonuclease [Pyrinomonadaceae bacterium]|nr:DNA/RNA non-specific endonuclease [Pyrinomonadaceae bacterium]